MSRSEGSYYQVTWRANGKEDKNASNDKGIYTQVVAVTWKRSAAVYRPWRELAANNNNDKKTILKNALHILRFLTPFWN